MSGSSTANPSASGDPCAGNSNGPWSRYGAASSIDRSGNLWLFGGDVYDWQFQESGPENDLWKFNPSAKTWTCYSASPSSNLYARQGASLWTDSNGNLWLFGGQSKDAGGASPSLDDLWEFSPTNNTWTEVTSTGNTPSARYGAAFWTDSSGNFWLLGGLDQPDSMTVQGSLLNDLWEFSPTTQQWTWVGGGTGVNAKEAAPPEKKAAPPEKKAAPPAKKKGMSAAARKRIAAAQKKRWAAVKAAKKATKSAPAKKVAKKAPAKKVAPTKKATPVKAPAVKAKKVAEPTVVTPVAAVESTNPQE